jgi:malonyl CoA-acyl carrier protein transacylase
MLTMGTEEFVEFGPGDVLTGLLKRIAPEASGWNFDSRETKD